MGESLAQGIGGVVKQRQAADDRERLYARCEDIWRTYVKALQTASTINPEVARKYGVLDPVSAVVKPHPDMGAKELKNYYIGMAAQLTKLYTDSDRLEATAKQRIQAAISSEISGAVSGVAPGVKPTETQVTPETARSELESQYLASGRPLTRVTPTSTTEPPELRRRIQAQVPGATEAAIAENVPYRTAEGALAGEVIGRKDISQSQAQAELMRRGFTGDYSEAIKRLPTEYQRMREKRFRMDPKYDPAYQQFKRDIEWAKVGVARERNKIGWARVKDAVDKQAVDTAGKIALLTALKEEITNSDETKALMQGNRLRLVKFNEWTQKPEYETEPATDKDYADWGALMAPLEAEILKLKRMTETELGMPPPAIPQPQPQTAPRDYGQEYGF
jgi:hypothetical protein